MVASTHVSGYLFWGRLWFRLCLCVGARGSVASFRAFMGLLALVRE